jgi:hypothetical protein
MMDGEHWSAVIAHRGENIRLISVRRSRTEEVNIYESEKFEHPFDESVDLMASLDLSRAKRVMQAQKRVNVDFPT